MYNYFNVKHSHRILFVWSFVSVLLFSSYHGLPTLSPKKYQVGLFAPLCASNRTRHFLYVHTHICAILFLLQIQQQSLKSKWRLSKCTLILAQEQTCYTNMVGAKICNYIHYVETVADRSDCAHIHTCSTDAQMYVHTDTHTNVVLHLYSV